MQLWNKRKSAVWALSMTALLFFIASAAMFWQVPCKSERSGSQPSVSAPLDVPSWWPRNSGKLPITHVYRIMRPDMDDLMGTTHKALLMDADSDSLRYEVLDALVFGSRVRSPFLHTCSTFVAAHRWRSMGLSRKKDLSEEECSALSQETVAVRIDIWAWYQSGSMPPQGVVDLSNHIAQKKFFKKGSFEEYGFDQDDAVIGVRHALEQKEILLKWRGKIPLRFFEVIDDVTGQVLGGFEGFVSKVKASKHSGDIVPRGMVIARCASTDSRVDVPEKAPSQAYSWTPPHTNAALSQAYSSQSKEVCVKPEPSQAGSSQSKEALSTSSSSGATAKWGKAGDPPSSTARATGVAQQPPQETGRPSGKGLKSQPSPEVIELGFMDLLNLSPPQRALRSNPASFETAGSQPSAAEKASEAEHGKGSTDTTEAQQRFNPEEKAAFLQLVEAAKGQKVEDLRAKVRPWVFEKFEEVQAAQKKYLNDMKNLTLRNERQLDSRRSEEVGKLLRREASSDFGGGNASGAGTAGKGFDLQRQNNRRRVSAELANTAAFKEFREQRRSLWVEHGNALLSLCGPIALVQKMHHERGEGGVATPNKSCTQMQRRKMDYCLGGAVASPNRSCAQRKRGGLKGAELPS